MGSTIVDWTDDEFDTVLIGRDKELEVLKDAVGEVEGGEGRCILISGEAGVGKTSLSQETGRYAEDTEGFELTYGRCQDSKTPFLPWIEIMGELGLKHLISREPIKLEYASIIDRTGMMLASIKTKESGLDDDILNSMVSVVRSFLEDSLNQMGMGAESKEHTMLQQGEYSIVLESGDLVTGMAITKGQVGSALVGELSSMVKNIHNKESEKLKAWQGNLQDVEYLQEYLNPLLRHRRGDNARIMDERMMLFDTVAQAIKERAQISPMVIIVDDLQWSDSSTKELFHYISRNTQDAPVMVLGIYRFEEVDESLKDMLEKMSRENLFSDIRLDRLSKKDISRMILRKYEHAPEQFTDAVFSKTDGNPFFVEEILRTLESEGRIDPFDKDCFDKLDLNSIAKISKTVDDVIARRLRVLEKEDYKVLEWMSVIGNSIDYNLLFKILKAKFKASKVDQDEIRRIMEEDPENAPAKIAELMEKPKEMDAQRMSEIVRTLSDAKLIKENGSFKFDNVLIKEAVYRNIPDRARQEMHNFVGECLEEIHSEEIPDVVEILSYQFVKARNINKALKYSMIAGDKAAWMSAPNEAMKHFENILSFRKELGTGNLVMVLDRVLQLSESVFWPKSIDYGEELINLADEIEDDTILSRAHRVVGWVRAEKNSENFVGLDYLEHALKYSKDNNTETLKNLRVKADILRRASKFDEAEELYEEIYLDSQDMEDEVEEAQIKLGLGAVCFHKGELGKSVDHFSDAIDILERIRRFDVLSRALNNMGVAYMKLDFYDEAIEAFTRSIDSGGKVGNEMGVLYSVSNICDVYAQRYMKYKRQVDLDNCFSYAERTSQLAMKLEHNKLLAVADGLFGMALGLKGEMEQSQERFEMALKNLKSIKEMDTYGNVLNDRAQLYHFHKLEDARIEDLKEARKVFKELGEDTRVEEIENELLALDVEI